MSGTLPLFEKYPALSGLPHVRLGLFPTPVQELHGLSESDNRVFIKRDDLSGLEYGGNKVRKLEFALGEAKANGCTDVITFGCDGSNHALATGIYAGKLGMHSISILRTQHNTRYLRKNLLKSAFYGIELHHCETKQEMDALTAPEALDARSVSCGLTSPLTYTSPDCVAASTVPTHFSGMRRMTASSSETARRWKRPGFFSVMRSTPPSSTTLTRSGVFAPRAAIETVLSVVE